MMKNKILYLTLFVIFAAGFTSCEDVTTGGVTGVTYYPTIEIEGDQSMIIDKGTEFVDPGYYSELNGEDVTDQVQVNSNLDTNTPGVYTIEYSMTNEDGFSASQSRTVYVADPTPSVISTGIHTTLPGTKRTWNDGTVVEFSGFDILLLQVEPGVFYISDFMGGYYDQNVGYGSNYAMTGKFRVNEDNTITAIESLVPGWGDSMDSLTEGTVDPETGQITYELAYAGVMVFTIIIN